MTESFDSGNEPHLRQPNQLSPSEEEDPQHEETVQKAYTIIKRWLLTGLSAGAEKFVTFNEDDETIIALSSNANLQPEDETIIGATGEPLVTITINPTRESLLKRESYGIGIDPTTGRKYMEKRPTDVDPEYIATPGMTEEQKRDLAVRQKQDHEIDRGTGKTRMTETETRAIADRISALTLVHRVFRPRPSY